MKWKIPLYGVVLGLLLVALQYFEYRWVILDNALEWYFGLIALLFTAVGIWAGRKLTAGKNMEMLAPERVEVSSLNGFTPNPKMLERLNITPREYEVLTLVAQGLSNREIADHMFVSLNTVKTHTSNVFSKLDAQRRTQAVSKAKALGLLP
jgi:two-component system, NarL family, response regulator LiaR